MTTTLCNQQLISMVTRFARSRTLELSAIIGSVMIQRTLTRTMLLQYLKSWKSVAREYGLFSREMGRAMVLDFLGFSLARMSVPRIGQWKEEEGLLLVPWVPAAATESSRSHVERGFCPGSGPHQLVLSCTAKCPNKCDYCYANSKSSCVDSMDDAEYFQLVTQVSQKAIPMIWLSGGEPMMRKERTLETARILSQNSRVGLLTSGYHLDRQAALELKAAGVRVVAVSLDGVDRVKFDQVRGRAGCYEEALAAIDACHDAGLCTQINICVGRDSFPTRKHINDFFSFVRNSGESVGVQCLARMRIGRAHQDENAFGGPDESKALADEIVRGARKQSVPLAMTFGNVDRALGCVGASGQMMQIDDQGNVRACISAASVGSVREESFDVLYDRFVDTFCIHRTGYFCAYVTRKFRLGDEGVINGHETREVLDSFAKEHPTAWIVKLHEKGRPLINFMRSPVQTHP